MTEEDQQYTTEVIKPFSQVLWKIWQRHKKKSQLFIDKIGLNID